MRKDRTPYSHTVTKKEKIYTAYGDRKAYGAAGSITVSRRDGSLAAIPYAAGETVLLAKTADLSVFTVAADCLVPGSGENGYCLTRKTMRCS